MITTIIVIAAVLALLGHIRGGLICQNGQVEDIALGTLAGRTSLQIDGDFGNATATFLAKRVRYFLGISGVTSGEGPFLVGMGSGNATTAEFTQAWVNRNTSGPLDETQTLLEDTSWTVVRDSMEMLNLNPSTVHAQTMGQWHVLGGGKGIPFPEGAGWILQVFNCDNAALSTGAVIKGTYEVQGVWLRD